MVDPQPDQKPRKKVVERKGSSHWQQRIQTTMQREESEDRLQRLNEIIEEVAETPKEGETPEEKKVYEKYHANFERKLKQQQSEVRSEEDDVARDRRKTKEMFFEHRAQLLDAIEVNEEAIQVNTEFET